MTGPRIDFFPPATRVMSPDEFEQAQSVVRLKPLSAAKPLEGMLVNRVLSPEEFDQAQSMTGPEVRRWKIPPVPKIAAEATRTKSSPTTDTYTPEQEAVAGVQSRKERAAKYGQEDTGLKGVLKRQLIAPVIASPDAAALSTGLLATPLAPVVAAAMGTSMLVDIAHYGYQKALEMSATPDARAELEADPERTSGEAAFVQAAMLGIGYLGHVAVKGYRSLDVSDGMMSGARDAAKSVELKPSTNETQASKNAIAEQHAGDRARANAIKNDTFAATLEQGAADAEHAHTGNAPKAPAGFTPTANTSRVGAGAAPVDGMIVPDAPKVGKVAPVGAVDQTAVIDEQAGIANAVTDYNRQRVGQDLVDTADLSPEAIARLRAGDAEKANQGTFRRRPKGEKAPFFESEQGAQTLGATAARHGLPDDANPYHADARPDLAAAWTEGHSSATSSYESFPEGFSMGGALTDNRIPADYSPPRVPGFEPHIAELPEGVTRETIDLANALKPSRYRGHSADELISAAVDAQTRLEKAQEASAHQGEGSAEMQRFYNEKGDLTDFAQNVDGNPFDAKTVAKELARAKSNVAQIEREAALKGITGDDLATRINDEKAARAEREGLAQEDALNFAFGEEPKVATAAGERITAVEGTGATRVREIARSVLQRAIVNGIEGVETPGTHTYHAVTHADQAAWAAQIVSDDPALARRIAFGEVNPPEGLVPDYVFIALERQAHAEGDVALINELANRNDATYAGQRVAAYATRDPDSAVGALKKMIDVRMSGEKSVPRATEENVTALRAQLKAMKLSPEQWATFVESLRC